jgi:hypothetical protein
MEDVLSPTSVVVRDNRAGHSRLLHRDGALAHTWGGGGGRPHARIRRSAQAQDEHSRREYVVFKYRFTDLDKLAGGDGHQHDLAG